MLVSILRRLEGRILDGDRGAQAELGVHSRENHLGQVHAELDLELVPDFVHHEPLHIHLKQGGFDLLVGDEVLAVGGLDAALGGADTGDGRGLGANAALADVVADGVFDGGRLFAGTGQDLADGGGQVWEHGSERVAVKVAGEVVDVHLQVITLEVEVALCVLFDLQVAEAGGIAPLEGPGVGERGGELVQPVGFEIHVVVVVEVWPLVALGIGAARPDVARERRAVDGDELAVVGELLVGDLVDEGRLLPREHGDAVAVPVGVVERGLAVGERLLRTLQDLLEVRILLRKAVGVDVERNRVLGKSERIHAGIGGGEAVFHGSDDIADDRQLRGGRAVDLHDSLVGERLVRRVVRRQERIHRHPAVRGGEAGARRPLAVAEGLLRV